MDTLKRTLPQQALGSASPVKKLCGDGLFLPYSGKYIGETALTSSAPGASRRKLSRPVKTPSEEPVSKCSRVSSSSQDSSSAETLTGNPRETGGNKSASEPVRGGEATDVGDLPPIGNYFFLVEISIISSFEIFSHYDFFLPLHFHVFINAASTLDFLFPKKYKCWIGTCINGFSCSFS